MVSKKYVYEYDDYESGEKDATTMAEFILNDPEMESLEEIVVGCWGECYDNNVQGIIETFVGHKDKFNHIKSLFIGDMTYEECEVSWINQGNYDELWAALPNLEKLIIQGSQDLNLGNVAHKNLKCLEIICGGLPAFIIKQIAKADLPELEKLNLYIGVDNYGFDGDINDIKSLLKEMPSFPKLKYLGIGDSDLQDEIAEAILESEVIKQLEVLDLSNGTFSDKGGQLILDQQEQLKHLKMLDLHHHFMSDEMMEKLEGTGITMDLSEQNENDEKYGNYPMLTE